MRALFDVNVLIALLDADHLGHSAATAWLASHLDQGWSSCPLTENGTARIMASGSYPHPYPVAAIVERLSIAKATSHHRFWPDEISLTDPQVFAANEILGPKQITNRYLLALAVKNGGRFVTFDQAITPSAVVGARPENLLRLPG